MWHVLLWYMHFLPRLWISPCSGWPEPQVEAAKAANLDTIAFEVRLGHRVENHLYRALSILQHQLWKMISEMCDEFGFRHSHAPSETVNGFGFYDESADCAEPGARWSGFTPPVF